MSLGRFVTCFCAVVAWGTTTWGMGKARATDGDVRPGLSAVKEAAAAEEEDGKSKKKKPSSKEASKKTADKKRSKKDKKKTAVADADLQYVKDHLEEFLSPSNIEWHEDGRVSLEFELREKSLEQAEIFTPSVGGDSRSPFRWSFSGEERVIGGERGIRLSDKGIAFFKPWYTDDVEVEVDFLQYSTFQPRRHLAALLYEGPRKALMANYGSETAYLIEGRKRSAKGKPWPIAFDTKASFVLRVQDGVFYGERDGRKTPERKYTGKTFDSGQVGLIWGGSISATIPRFTVTGRLDPTKTAKMMRAAAKGRR